MKSRRGIASDTRAELRTKADKAAAANGCYFDPAAADRAVQFFETVLVHSIGQWAGKPFLLQPWQRDHLVRPLFGWMAPDGTRRFRVGYVEIPKKNGKSTGCSGIALYLGAADRERGAQVYLAAADKEQASIVYREARNMVKSSRLSSLLTVTDSKKRIDDPDTDSFIRVISSEAYTAEGLNIHGLIFDELHAQKTRELWDALRYGGAARRQPLLLSITTAGWDTSTICYEQHEYAQKVLAGDIEDDGFFALIYAADKGDDWTKPATWKKANPSYGVTISERDFASACAEAQASPVKQNAFKRYRLNMWTEQAERWLKAEAWAACAPSACNAIEWRARKLAAVVGRQAFAGLDLGSTSDLSALVALFPEDGTLLPFFWVPESALQARDNPNRDLYRTWAGQGFLIVTPGNVMDYDRVRADLKALPFGVREIAVDRNFQGAQLCTQLAEDGNEIIAFGQGFFSMAAPAKEFERRVIAGEFNHGNNPILNWMASNVAVEQDAAGNMKPVKPKRGSPFKVDGIVAAIMALGRAMLPAGNSSASVYEERGIRSL